MKQIVTTGIVLTRTDFGEADRILSVITPDHGKVRLMAKGVRRIKSKLAGGIELFSISQITFIEGKGDIKILVSTRLQKHFGNIVQNIDRTMFGYDILKLINNVTEDNTGKEYFELLSQVLESLDDASVTIDLITFWLYAQLLRITGHSPNVRTDTRGQKLETDGAYGFDFDAMAFAAQPQGKYNAQHIKLQRLALGLESPLQLHRVQGIDMILPDSLQLAKTMLSQFVRL